MNRKEEDGINSKKFWENLKPGDALTVEQAGPNFKTVVLEKNKKGIVLSAFCQEPLTIEQINMPIRWSEKHNAVIDVTGQPAVVFQSAKVQKNLYPGIPKKYKRLKKLRKLSKKREEDLLKLTAIKRAEIEVLIKLGTNNQQQIASLALNRVFGPKGYTDEQFVALSHIIASYESMLNDQQDIIEQKEGEVKLLQRQISKEIQYGFSEALVLVGTDADGSA